MDRDDGRPACGAKGNNREILEKINLKTGWRKAAPYIFVVGLLCWLLILNDWIQSKYILVCQEVAGGGFFVWLPKTIANLPVCAALVDALWLRW